MGGRIFAFHFAARAGAYVCGAGRRRGREECGGVDLGRLYQPGLQAGKAPAQFVHRAGWSLDEHAVGVPVYHFLYWADVHFFALCARCRDLYLVPNVSESVFLAGNRKSDPDHFQSIAGLPVGWRQHPARRHGVVLRQISCGLDHPCRQHSIPLVAGVVRAADS